MHKRTVSSPASSPSAVAQQSARHALLLLLVLSVNVRKALVGAYDAAAALSTSKPTSKPRIEIRVQDFSFSEGPTERPVIEIEAKDMKGSEIYDAILAMAFDESLKDADSATEQEQHEDQLSNQDALLLVFFVLCFFNLVYFGAASFWILVKRALTIQTKPPKVVELSFSSGSELDNGILSDGGQQLQQYAQYSAESNCSDDSPVSELFVRQNALIRLCHLQFLVLAEKLKQEINGGGSSGARGTSDGVSQMIASLPVSQLDKENVQLSDIMQVLEQIPLKEHGLSNERIENQMSAIQQDLLENDLDITGAWSRLQELYKSFQSIQLVIQSRKRSRSQSQSHLRRASRAVSLDSGREPYAEEVLGELKRVVPRLPVGFTADMFASLGQAIQLQTIPDRRIARPNGKDETTEAENKPKQD